MGTGEDGRELIKMLDKRMGNPKMCFFGGTQYRHGWSP